MTGSDTSTTEIISTTRPENTTSSSWNSYSAAVRNGISNTSSVITTTSASGIAACTSWPNRATRMTTGRATSYTSTIVTTARTIGCGIIASTNKIHNLVATTSRIIGTNSTKRVNGRADRITTISNS